MVSHRRILAAIAVVALAHAAFYIWYQQPDWDTAWTDQGGYQLLGRGIVETGQFTRYADAPEFVPEALRTPGYPLFVAAVYATLGESKMAVVTTHAFVFALLCLLVFRLAREVTSERLALTAAAATALYPIFPYFGGLVLTELWTTFVLTAGLWCALVALRTGQWRWFAAAGLLVGWTSLTRPGFFLLPAFLIAVTVLDVARAHARRQRIAGWAIFFAAFACVMGPWFAYNYRHFGEVTLSTAGNLGRPIWESSWQGHWSGRVQAALTNLAEQDVSDGETRAEVARLAADAGADEAPMLEYVRQWRTIRQIWTTPTDPEERVRARIESTQEYGRVGWQNIRQDPGGFVWRRLTRGFPVLWIGDVPIRHSDINTTPPWIIRSFWGVQAILMLLAVAGLWQVGRHRGLVLAAMMAVPLIYVTAVHVPILSESRQSLPAKPLVLVLATVGAAHLWSQRRAHLP